MIQRLVYGLARIFEAVRGERAKVEVPVSFALVVLFVLVVLKL